MELAACERLGVKPQECVIVEDAEHGIEAARKAGANVCVVSGFSEVDYERVNKFIEKVQAEN